MSRLALAGAFIAGLALPVALALAVYAASAGSLSEPVPGTRLPAETIARPSAAKKVAKPKPARTTPPAPPATTGIDESGSCDEAEHADDPRCTGAATEDDDRSGRSGSSGGSGDSSNSGSGSSDNSGGDDSSGPGGGSSGSGGSDSSGSGSGDD
jgi:hypothetical protein